MSVYRDHVRDFDSETGTTWGTFVRTARTNKQITIEDLADRLGVDRKTVMRMESGETRRLDVRLFLSVCKELGVRPGDAIEILDPDGVELTPPPPLPPTIAELVRLYLGASAADRDLLLARVQWVVDWFAMYSGQRPSGRQNVRQNG